MGVIFTNLNLNNNLIELVEEEVEGEVEINKEAILYNPREGYMDFEIIEETNNKVEYRR
jgi:hypothetical protein